MKYDRIILLGLPKNGNTTIHNTLLHLGYNFIQHWDDISPDYMSNPNDPIQSQKEVVNIPKNSGIALGTMAQLKLWKEYTIHYPDALFVLNTRSDKTWLTSHFKHIWYDWSQNEPMSQDWPPNVDNGIRQLGWKNKHEADIENGIKGVAYIRIDIGEKDWQAKLISCIDSSVDIDKLLTKGYSYPGFQFESVQMRSKLTELHSNYRLDSSLPKEHMNNINKVVDEALLLHKR